MKRKVVGGLLILFFILLIATIINLIVELPGAYVIYTLFAIDFLCLFVLFIRLLLKSIKKSKNLEEDVIDVGIIKKLFGDKETIIALAIALIAVTTIIIVNFEQKQDYWYQTFNLDIGAKDEISEIISLQKSSLISEKKAEYDNGKLITYRELLRPFTQIDVEVPNKWSTMNLTIKFKGSLPSNSNGFYVRFKKNEEGYYNWQRFYKSNIDLSNYEYIEEDGLYLYYILDDIPKFESISDFLENIPTDKIIAYDNNLLQNKPNDNLKWEKGDFFLDNTLRGTHEFYIYAKGDLKISFIKEDLNWYDGEDILDVSLYDFDGSLVKSIIIEDDGINDTSKEILSQNSSFEIDDLSEGVYLLKFTIDSGDVTFKDLSINQLKVAFNEHIFPLENFSFYSEKNSFTFQTWHDSSIQVIKLGDDSINVNKRTTVFKYKNENNLNAIVPKGDVLISATNVFSQSLNNHFNPLKYKLIEVDSINDLDVDYLLADFNYISENDWVIVNKRIKNKDIYYKEKLSLILQTKPLDKKVNNTIFLDFIKIKYNE